MTSPRNDPDYDGGSGGYPVFDRGWRHRLTASPTDDIDEDATDDSPGGQVTAPLDHGLAGGRWRYDYDYVYVPSSE